MKYFPFLLLLLVVSCSESDTVQEKKAVDSLQTVHATAQKIELQYPKTWIHSFTSDSNLPNSVLAILSPLENQEDSYQENLKVYHEVLPMRISDSLYHQSAIAELRIKNPNLTIENRGTQRFGNQVYNEWYFQFENNTTAYCVHGYTCMRDSVGYNFAYTTVKSNEKKYAKEVEQILSSFKPL